MKEKQKLAFLIDFINQDIESRSKGDLLKMISDIIDLGMGYDSYLVDSFVDGKGVLPLEVLPETRDKLKELQNRLRGFLAKILATKNRKLGLRDPGYKLSFDTRKFISAFGGRLVVGFEGRGEYDIEFDFAQLIYDCFLTEEKGWFHEDALDEDFSASLDNIRQCRAPGCNNYFLRLYKKEKFYCSNKCAWRAHSNLKRAESKKGLGKKEKKGGK
jgi:hypothetical protein